jgi:hypothetical protein
MKLFNESMRYHVAGGICGYLNRLLYEVLGSAPVIILTIFIDKVKIFLLLEELPQKIILFLYNIMKVCIVN